MLKKLERFEEHKTDYPDHLINEYNRLTEKLDKNMVEEIRDLIERVYKIGYQDGIRFMDWLIE